METFVLVTHQPAGVAGVKAWMLYPGEAPGTVIPRQQPSMHLHEGAGLLAAHRGIVVRDDTPATPVEERTLKSWLATAPQRAVSLAWVECLQAVVELKVIHRAVALQHQLAIVAPQAN